MITVAGLTPSVDLTYVVDHLELGRIHRPTEVVRRAGGKPLNLARAAAALGADVSIVAVLGGWTGDWLADELARAEIAVHRVTTPVLTRTCVSISAADSEELTELYEYAEPIPADVWTQAREALITELDRTAAAGWSSPAVRHEGCHRQAWPSWPSSPTTPAAGSPPTPTGPRWCRLLHSHPELVKINRPRRPRCSASEPTPT